MRRFTDRDGRAWEVVLGRESWGTTVALFVPPSASAEVVRQSALGAAAYDAAMRELENMDDAGLQSLLDASRPKES